MSRPPSPASVFSTLSVEAPDPLLSLIALHARDPRPHKIDLGVGVYRDDAGHTPVMAAMKAAERVLLEGQETKTYLGPAGDPGFLDKLRPLVFGDEGGDLIGLQTPGGTGALRLAAALLNAARPGAAAWIGAPSWPIHAPILQSAGLKVRTWRHLDPNGGGLDYDALVKALQTAEAGDLILLHGCCHNPTGVGLDEQQWGEVARLIARRGLIPLIDLAYQGLGDGLDEDAVGVRAILREADEALIAYSCDKNFGLYRERTGALYARARGSEDAARSTLFSLARYLWSMPPDHGAAAVRVILESPDLNRAWRAELDAVRERLNGLRQAAAEAHPDLAFMAGQRGMFSMLPLTPDQVVAMREEHAVYMASSGRINIAGLTLQTVPRLAQAFDAVRQG